MTFFSSAQSRLGSLISKPNPWLLPFVYGSTFILIFWSAYRFINPDFYMDRDDGVITYSHVVHLVKYGYIGVSPSGERLEGFSNPLDFLMYLFFYGLFSTDFHSYNFWKTVLCTFGIGVVFSFFFGNKGKLGYFLSFGAAVVLACNTRFMGWHGSGLENPLSNFLLLCSVWVLYRAVVLLKMDYWGGLVLLLACITRAEGLYYIFPLMGLGFLFVWIENGKSYIKPFLRMCSVAIAGLLALFVARYLYFGAFLPNTSLALGIHVSDNLKAVYHRSEPYFSESGGLFLYMARHNNFWFLILSLPLLYFTDKSRHILWVLCGITTIFLLGFAHPFIFHSGRLDPARYTLQLAPIAVFFPAWLLVNLPNIKQKLLFIVLYAAVFVSLNFGLKSLGDYDSLCCDIKIFQDLDKGFAQLTKENQIHRPLLANPDLGIISIQKKYNILDMAYLASPQLALLTGVKPIQSDYIFELAGPNILELHEYWACNIWSELLLDKRMSIIYKPLNSFSSPCNPKIMSGTFVRRAMLKESQSPERKFYEQVKKILINKNQSSIDNAQKENFVKLIENEITFANSLVKADVYAPSYLIRILYQFWPEIRTNNLEAIIIKTLDKFVLKDLAILKLTSATNKHWAKQTASEVVRLFLVKHLKTNPNTSLEVMINADLITSAELFGKTDFGTVYYSPKHIIYLLNLDKINKTHPFIFHIRTKADPNNFKNLDFNLPARGGFEAYGKLIYVQSLPADTNQISNISTGQYQGNTETWRIEKRFE